MKKQEKIKICLASSSGGHFEQLMMLKPLIEKYDGYVVTEKIGYDIKVDNIPVKYVMPINRTDKAFILKFLCNVIKSFFIIIGNKPDFIISTGALAAVPLMFRAHLMKPLKKLRLTLK